MNGKTVAVFRMWKCKGGTAIALFPGIAEGAGLCMSFQHVGQHSAADYRYVIAKTRPAKPSEYKDLLHELVQRGYDLKVVQHRAPHPAITH
jgi:hypothetical protein